MNPRVLSAGGVGVVATLALATAWAIGVSESLRIACTEIAYQHAWLVYSLWLFLACLATPRRVWRLGGFRVAVHVGVLLSVLAWWVLVVALADLYSRHDRLWLAYVIAVPTLAVWRWWLHPVILRTLVWSAIRGRHPDADGPVMAARLGGAMRSDGYGPGWVPSDGLFLLAKCRDCTPVRSALAWVWGARGGSAIILQVVQAATDRHLHALRKAIRNRADLLPPVTYLGKAWELEVRVALAVAAGDESSIPRKELHHRCVGIMEALAQADIASAPSGSQEGEDHGTAAEALPALFVCVAARGLDAVHGTQSASRSLGGLLDGLRGNTSALMQWGPKKFQEEGLEVAPQAILRIAVVAALARNRLFRPAKALLSEWVVEGCRSASDPQESGAVGFREQARRIASSLCAAIELASVEVAEIGALKAQTGDQVASDQAGGMADEIWAKKRRVHRWAKEGLHPSKEDPDPDDLIASVSASSVGGECPVPSRALDPGAGMVGAVVALGCLFVGLWIVADRGLSPTVNVIRDVPFGGPIGYGGEATTAHFFETTNTLFVPRSEGGVATLSTESFRARLEGGPGTQLDGVVTELGADPSGAALAAFEDRQSGSTCLSVRDPSGEWTHIIPPADESVKDLRGADLMATIGGCGDPLLVFRGPGLNIVRYNQRRRCLERIAVAGISELSGEIVAADSVLLDGQERGCAVLTDSDGGRVYYWRPAGRDSITVSDYGTPPLGEGEKLVAVSLGVLGTAVAVSDRGRAWIREEGLETLWEPIRAGDQALDLDAVLLAAISPEGGRLWLVLEGGEGGYELWSRAILGASEPLPVDGTGWRKGSVRDGVPVSRDGRCHLTPSGEDAVVLVRLPSESGQTGVAEMYAVSGEGVIHTVQTVVTNLVDADAHEGVLLTTTLHDGGTRQHLWSSKSPQGNLMRDQPGLQQKSEAALGEGVMAISPLAGEPTADAVAVTRTGRVLSINVATDTVGPYRSGETLIQLPFDGPVDAAVARPGTRSGIGVDVAELRIDGTVAMHRVGSGPLPAARLVIQPSGAPPNTLLGEMRVALAAPEAVMIFGTQSAWRWSGEDSAHPWSELALPGTGNRSLFGTYGSTGSALAVLGVDSTAWLCGSAGIFPERKPGRVTELWPTLNVAAVGRVEDGSLWRLDPSWPSAPLLSVTDLGPSNVLASGLRGAKVDYLAPDWLSVFDGESGRWTKSGAIPGAELELFHIGQGAGATALLLPTGAGNHRTAWFTPPTAGADSLRVLGSEGGVRWMAVEAVESGVVGLTGPSAACFVEPGDPDRPRVDALQSEPGMDLFAVSQAVVHAGGSVMYLLGTDSGGPAKRVVKYGLGRVPPRATVPGADAFTTMVVDERRLLAASAGAVTQCDAESLVTQTRWDLSKLAPAAPELGALGSGEPVCTAGGGLYRLRPGGVVEELIRSVQRLPTGEPFQPTKAAALGSELWVFSSAGVFRRGAASNQPFDRVSAESGVPAEIVVDHRDVWVPDGPGWRGLGSGRRSAGCIGVIGGAELVLDTREGALTFVRAASQPAESALNPFVRPSNPLTVPSAVEALPSGDLLLCDETHALVFDPTTRLFSPLPVGVQGVDASARVVARAQRQFTLQSSAGVVFTATTDRSRWVREFGGSAVTECLPSHGLAIRRIDGVVVTSESGAPAGGQPDSTVHYSQSPAARFVDAIPSRSATGVPTIVRLREDRTVQLLNLETMSVESTLGEADALAVLNDVTLAFDRRTHSIRLLDGAEAAHSLDEWAIGKESIALKSSEGNLLSLQAQGAPRQVPLGERLPGRVVATQPGTSIGICQIEDETYQLYDLVSLRAVGDRFHATSLAVSADVVLAMQRLPDRCEVHEIEDGRSVRSSACLTAAIGIQDGKGACWVGLRTMDDGRTFTLELKDPSGRSAPKSMGMAAPRQPICSSGQNLIHEYMLNPSTPLLIGHTGVALVTASGITSTSCPEIDVEAIVVLVGEGGREAAVIADGEIVASLSEREGVWKLTASHDESRDAIKSPLSVSLVHSMAIRAEDTTRDTGWDPVTGWIAGELPVSLEQRASGELWLVAASGQKSLVSPEWATIKPGANSIAAPYQVDSAGSVCRREGDRVVVICSNERDRKPACQDIDAFAPVGRSAVAWIDRLGQLWWCSVGSSGPISVPISSRPTGFRVTADGALFVAAGEDPARPTAFFPLGNDGTLGGGRSAALAEFFADCGALPNAQGRIRWQRDGRFIQWSVRLEHHVPLTLSATAAGFRECVPLKLGTIDSEAVARVKIGDTCLAVPIRDARLDWAGLHAPPAVTDAPSPTGLRVEANLGGGVVVKCSSDGASLECDGRVAQFDPAKGRFSTEVVGSATSVSMAAPASTGTELVYTVQGQVFLQVCRLSTNGGVTFLGVIQPPTGVTNIASMWPGADPQSLVIRARTSQGEQRWVYRSTSKSWTPEPAPSFVDPLDSAWEWGGTGGVRWHGENYDFLPFSTPVFACDSVEVEPRPAYSLFVSENGRTRFRGLGGSWFELADKGMPVHWSGAVPTRAIEHRLDYLRVAQVGSAVVATVVSGGEELPIDLALVDGLIPSIDQLVAGTLSRTGPMSAEARCFDSRFERVITCQAGRSVQLGPPVKSSPSVEPPVYRSKREFGDISLDATGGLTVRGTPLGAPTAKGFPLLDPKRAYPLGVQSNQPGGLVYISSGRVICVDEDRPFASLKELEGVSIGVPQSSAWSGTEGGRALLVAGSAGMMWIDCQLGIQPAAAGTTAPIPFVGEGSPGGLQIESASASGVELRGRLAKGALDTALVPGGDGHLRALHEDVDRIAPSGDGFETRGATHGATYLREGDAETERWRLVEAGRRGPEWLAREVQELGQGLLARWGEHGWETCLGPEPTAPIWPWAAFFAPSRSYAARLGTDADKAGVLEVGNGWARVLQSDAPPKRIVGPDAPSELGSQTVYRVGELLCHGQRCWELDDTGSPKPMPEGSPVPRPGSRELGNAVDWSLDLAYAGGSCTLAARGSVLNVSDGALSVDYAVSTRGLRGGALICDRHGLEFDPLDGETSRNPHRWSPHSGALQARIRSVKPTRAVEDRESGERFVPLGSSGDGARLPVDPSGAVTLGRLEQPLLTRALSKDFGVALLASRPGAEMPVLEEVVLTRRTERGELIEYAAVSRKECCKNGRLPFDQITEVFMAHRPGFGGESACIRMERGWEWLSEGRLEHPARSALALPERIPPRFSGVIDPQWLTGAPGLTVDQATEWLTAVAGRPVLAFPKGDRIFMVGTDRTVWMELGPRWLHNRAGH